MIPKGCDTLSGTAIWTPTTQQQHNRDGLRYETDLTDAEWAVIEPLLPPALAARPAAQVDEAPAA